MNDVHNENWEQKERRWLREKGAAERAIEIEGTTRQYYLRNVYYIWYM